MSVGKKLIEAASGVGGVDTGDDDFANVVLLLDGDGTSGDDNNTFTDSSTNGFTVTENGSVVQGSFSPYGDNWSNYFDGNQYLTSDTAAPAIGTNDFTIEFWYNGGAQPNRYPSIVGTLDAFSATGAWRVHTYVNNANSFQFTYGTTNYQFTTTDYNDGVWRHFAVTREGTNLKGFVNGVQQGSTLTFSGSLSSRKIMVAGQLRDNDHQEGFISNVRVINGTALYTSNFTPPTGPLSAVTNTDFLACQSNRFLDNSSNSFAFTLSGTPQVSPFSPFKNDDARDIATDGGSGYFNLSTSYLTYSGGSSSVSDITISFWVYVTGSMGANGGLYPRIFASASGALLIYTRDDDIRIYNSGEKLQTPIIQNEWHHFVAQRTSNTWEMWLDGDSKGTYSDSTAVNLNTTNHIGRDTTNAGYFGGYISDFKITEGSEGYSGNFTPPSSPVSAGSSDLLLSFQDAGIYDRSGINNLDTLGNAQIDTAVKKYGTGSMEFDGSGDYLKGITSADELNMGTGDWTVEGWYYVKTRTTAYPLIIGNNDTGFNAGALAITHSNNDGAPSRHDKLAFANYDDASLRVLSASSAHNLNQWYHFAVVRNGTNITIYRDGTSVASKTISSSLTYDWGLNGVLVGGGNWDGAGSYSDAYYDDLRITKGIARYTSSFTPPTAELPKF